MKIDRQKVYERYNGRCAYCGDKIAIARMQVDHFWPKNLAYLKPDIDMDGYDNLMPACQPCNIHKHAMVPELYRRELARTVAMLMKTAQFKRALKFKQITIISEPIVFYYEQFVKPELPETNEDLWF